MSTANLFLGYGRDVTPDALAWDDISKTNINNSPSTTSGNTQTISGINTSITLQVDSVLDVPPAAITPTLACFKNGASVFTLALSDPSDSNTVDVVAGDTIQFKMTFSGSIADSCENTITVTNNTTSTVLDTFSTLADRA